MKRKYLCALLLSLFLTSCNNGVSEDMETAQSNCTDLIQTESVETTAALNVTITTQSREEQTEAVYMDCLDAIVYNGKCYYGLAMRGFIFKEEDLPDSFTCIGTISEITESFVQPDGELATTSAVFKTGDEIYYADFGSSYGICFLRKAAPEAREARYEGLFYCTDSKPDYYR